MNDHILDIILQENSYNEPKIFIYYFSSKYSNIFKQIIKNNKLFTLLNERIFTKSYLLFLIKQYTSSYKCIINRLTIKKFYYKIRLKIFHFIQTEYINKRLINKRSKIKHKIENKNEWNLLDYFITIICFK